MLASPKQNRVLRGPSAATAAPVVSVSTVAAFENPQNEARLSSPAAASAGAGAILAVAPPTNAYTSFTAASGSS
jgi:hypothetical protein